MELEPNNIISAANISDVSSTGERSATIGGTIKSLSDIDLYQFQLDQGDGITLDLDTISVNNSIANFDPYLRVFDETGNELALNDDFSVESEQFSLDSYLGFIANVTGTYYVGVSSVGNSNYNPLNGDNSHQFNGNLTPADYELNFNIVEVIADEDTNNTISEATVIDTTDRNNNLLDGRINLESDVDVFQVEVLSGQGIRLKLNGEIDNSQLDSYLRLFDSEGNELGFDDNSTNNLPENPTEITTNSRIDFAPEIPGEYFIGVSSAGNFDYDPINGDTNLNFSPNNGISRGKYQLEVDIVEIVADDDPDNTILEAVDTGVTSAEDRQGAVSGEINPELDADLYRVQLDEGDGIYLNLNAKSINSELDSFLRIFDEEGNELTFDNNDDANFTEDFSTDSAIAFAPETPGEYFIGVSDASNYDYDPVNGRTNFSSNITSPFSTAGNYELEINILNVILDEDADNTIAEAVDSRVSSAGRTSRVLTKEIDSPSDVDIYRFQLDRGEGITFDLDAAIADSNLDSYLRLFDSEGNELAFDDDDDHNIGDDDTVDSLLNFIAYTSGEYYLGVSSEGNITYDPINGSSNFSNTSGFSTGSYELAIDISPVVVDEDADNTIAEAIETGASSAGEQSVTMRDEIASVADVDVYKFQLDAGDTITLDIDAAIQDSSLDSVLRLFDSWGNEINNNDDRSADNEDFSNDSFIEFTTETDGEYYVGVSSFANFAYDPLEGSTNFSNNVGTSTGDYDLNLTISP